jgi:multiple antibiotic resistance protein
MLVYIQLIAIMDPFGAVVTFMGLTSHLGVEERRMVARHVFWAILVLLVVFMIAGKGILAFFNISIPGLRLGGGILLLAIAIDMLGGMPRSKSLEPAEIAMVPLATPLLVGPGAMTTVILQTTQYSYTSILAGIAAASITTYLMLRYSGRLFEVMGRNTMRALGRFMAIIIAAIAADMILAAVRSEYLALIGQQS